MAPPRRFRVQPQLTDQVDFEFGASSYPLHEFFFLGRPAEIGPSKRILFDVATEHVLAVVGKRGSGKSFTLGSLAEALGAVKEKSTLGSNKRRCATLLFDTLNIYPYTEVPLSSDSPLPLIRKQYKLLTGWPIEVEKLDVTVWVPAGHRLSGSLDHYRDLAISCSDLELDDWAAILDLDTTRDPQGQLLGDVHDFVADRGSHFTVADMLQALESAAPFLSVYHDETIRALKRQLSALAKDGLFTKIGTPIEQLLRPGNVAILLTNQLPDAVRAMLASVLFKKILALRSVAAFARKQLVLNDRLTPAEKANAEASTAKSIPPVWLLIDEAQNVIPSGRQTGASQALIKLVREGRNSGISVVVTTQQPGAIDQRILAQVDTLLIHQLVTQPDLEAVRRNLKSSDPAEVKYGDERLTFDGVVRSLGVGQCVVSSTDANRWFVCSTRPRVAAHGGIGAATAEA